MLHTLGIIALCVVAVPALVVLIIVGMLVVAEANGENPFM